MAQVDSPTAKVYAACAAAIKGDSHDSITHICLDEASMAAFDEDSNAAGTECVVSGLARAAATLSLSTTTKTNDTVEATKVFTAGGAATIKGALAMSAAAAGNCLSWCKLNSDYVMAIGEQVQPTFKLQFKKD